VLCRAVDVPRHWKGFAAGKGKEKGLRTRVNLKIQASRPGATGGCSTDCAQRRGITEVTEEKLKRISIALESGEKKEKRSQ